MKFIRNVFRQSVFDRDNHQCVICGLPAKDAHHIIERRLFEDGGYYLDNGASLCEVHHLEAEMTILSSEEIREAAGITSIVLPSHLYESYKYDKWGNIVMPNGIRIKGELFYDESVQKILNKGAVLHLFSKYVKYPRTYHLPWSKSLTKDDKMLSSFEGFENERVIVTEKMDGEQTTMYSDYIHSRSINSGSHPSRSWVKNLWGQIYWKIPEGWRVCGENLYAKHSIHYKQLDTYFLAFNVWDAKNNCTSWDDFLLIIDELNLSHPKVLYDGMWDEKVIKDIEVDEEKSEGYVVRVAREFSYSEFKNVVAKYVRANHVHSHGHWMQRKIIKNEIL